MRRLLVWLVDTICAPIDRAIDSIDFSDIGDDE
jgi:hypothetical protein